jgi:hypothetical protein
MDWINLAQDSDWRAPLDGLSWMEQLSYSAARSKLLMSMIK